MTQQNFVAIFAPILYGSRPQSNSRSNPGRFRMMILGILIGVPTGLLWLTYVVFVVVPITHEAIQETAKRRFSAKLTSLIEQGQIQVDSPEYWQAIELMVAHH